MHAGTLTPELSCLRGVNDGDGDGDDDDDDDGGVKLT